MRHEESVAVDHRGVGNEGVGLAVIPVALGAVIVSLVLDGDVVGDLQFKAAAQPQLMRADGVVGDVVVGLGCPRVHRHRRDEVAGEGVNS